MPSIVPMSHDEHEAPSERGLERREFLEILTALGVTGAAALGAWRALEWDAASRHGR